MTDSTIELWRQYRRTRDPEIRDRLVTHHLQVVKFAAARIAGRLPSHLRMEDLYSAGLLGFLTALEDYDPERGVEFGAYASPRIRGAIFDELRRMDCVPRRVRRKIKDADRAIDRLMQRLKRHPADAEIAQELGVSVDAYHALLNEGVTLFSLDAASGADDHAPAPLEALEDMQSPNPLLSVAVKERREILSRVIERLPDKEQQVLSLYYVEELTMAEVGRVLGVTESRVSQIHSSAILRVRAALRRERVTEGQLTVATPVAVGRHR
jgi:RNA polymerase sigma factor FliA